MEWHYFFFFRIYWNNLPLICLGLISCCIGYYVLTGNAVQRKRVLASFYWQITFSRGGFIWCACMCSDKKNKKLYETTIFLGEKNPASWWRFNGCYSGTIWWRWGRLKSFCGIDFLTLGGYTYTMFSYCSLKRYNSTFSFPYWMFLFNIKIYLGPTQRCIESLYILWMLYLLIIWILCSILVANYSSQPELRPLMLL